MATLARPDALLVSELWSDFERAEETVHTARLRYLTTHDGRHWDEYLEADRIATEARLRAEAAHQAYYSA